MKIIEAEQLRDKMSKASSLLVVNVLSPEYFNKCHIKNSINVPLDTLNEKSGEWAKDQEIVVYCASYECSASRKAYEQLEGLGFTNVLAYEGGIKEWKEKGFNCGGECSS